MMIDKEVREQKAAYPLFIGGATLRTIERRAKRWLHILI